MATVIIGSDAGPVVRRVCAPVVRVKASWADDWEWAPYLRAVRAASTSGAGSYGVFRQHYGEILEHGFWSSSIIPPFDYRGLFVSVWKYEFGVEVCLWVGYFPECDDELRNRPDVDSGVMTFRALGLDYFLRREIQEYPTDNGWIPRALRFNALPGRGWTLEGNRSADVGGDDHYVFSDDGEVWTNLDIAELLLKGYAGSGITWTLTGETDVLDRIVEEHSFYRYRLSTALDHLIQRERGLGWVLRTSGEAGASVEVHVYSTLSLDVSVGDYHTPANSEQVVVDYRGAHDLGVRLTHSDVNLYDAIEVNGGMVYSAFSLTPGGGGLEPGWSAALEAEYKTVDSTDGEEADRLRQSDKFSRVFRYFRVPNDWDWEGDNGLGTNFSNAAPTCDDDGNIVVDEKGIYWNSGHTFERFLPWEEESDGEGIPDYRRPFVLLKDQDENFQYSDWFTFDGEQYFMRLVMADREMAVRMDGRGSHILALNHWEGASPSQIEPPVDYEDMSATVMCKTDTQLRVRVDIPERDTGLTKLIDYPEAVAWYVVPGTVEDIIDGTRVSATSGLVRDDSERLRAIASLAVAWYGAPRSMARLDIEKQLSTLHRVGSMILSAYGPGGSIDVGTVVTRKEWDFERFSTVVQTGFDEMRIRK